MIIDPPNIVQTRLKNIIYYCDEFFNWKGILGQEKGGITILYKKIKLL